MPKSLRGANSQTFTQIVHLILLVFCGFGAETPTTRTPR
jgi:hypothetical protein